MRKRREHGGDNTDRWVVSYADFITLLFAFFTTMYAISHVDVGKLEKFAGSMKSAFKASGSGSAWQVIEGISPASPDVIGIEKEFRKAISALQAQEDITVRRDERGIVVSLSDSVLFDSGQADVKESALPALAAVTSVIRKIPNSIIIEGHTDSVPIKNSRYSSNWELSTARALSVLGYMLRDSGLSPERFSLAGYAEFRPMAPNETPGGRDKNRRVDIVIIEDR